jgi:hypothetical protein
MYPPSLKRASLSITARIFSSPDRFASARFARQQARIHTSKARFA